MSGLTKNYVVKNGILRHFQHHHRSIKEQKVFFPVLSRRGSIESQHGDWKNINLVHLIWGTQWLRYWHVFPIIVNALWFNAMTAGDSSIINRTTMCWLSVFVVYDRFWKPNSFFLEMPQENKRMQLLSVQNLHYKLQGREVLNRSWEHTWQDIYSLDIHQFKHNEKYWGIERMKSVGNSNR